MTQPSKDIVSMKSGLEGRNNGRRLVTAGAFLGCLNEVRPRRPEQSARLSPAPFRLMRLNEVRPRRPEQFGRINSQ